jgi:hypothetical protein
VIQRLTGSQFGTPRDVVACLGAVQAQDYAGAKWALAQRTRDATDAQLDRAFDRGEILRTHVMRPTWHFVAPEDIRWLLALTAPRVHAANAFMYRKLELDSAVLRRSLQVIARALADTRHLTRTELGSRLAEAGIVATALRLSYIVMHAEIEGWICSGPRRGKQFTYVLLDERVPPATSRPRDWALAELTRRYFSAHGPAVLRDFVWWSGLTVVDAKAGLEMAAADLTREAFDGQTWWFSEAVIDTANRVRMHGPTVRLLPNYDESVTYQERSPHARLPLDRTALERVLAAHILTIDGQIAGGWRRDVQRKGMTLHVTPLRPLIKSERDALRVEADRYQRFIAVPVELALAPPIAGRDAGS